MYLYEGCRDPIQKITGDAYRRIWGIKPGNNYSGGKQSQTRLNYEQVDAVIRENIETTPATEVSRIAGINETTLKKRCMELGYEYDKATKRWVKEAA